MTISATATGATVAAHPAAGQEIGGGTFGTSASEPSVPESSAPSSSFSLAAPSSPFRRPKRPPVASPSLIGSPTGTANPAIVSALSADGIPITALDAYRQAAAKADPACGISWPLLAAIGRVESNHGQFAHAVLHSDGTSTPPIIGIRLDGSRSVVVRDTDHGRLDGDVAYDHAVGPMQFIPSTWAAYRADGNGDGRDDPFNVYDAAAAAATYLCRAGGDLRTTAGQQRAVWSYNPSTSYVSEVLALEAAYAAGASIAVPAPPAVVTLLPPPTLPPVNPAPALAASVAPHTAAPTTKPPAPSPTATGQPTNEPSPSGSPVSSSASASSTASTSSAPTPTATASAPAGSCSASPTPSSANPSTSSGSTTSADPSATPSPEPTPSASTSPTPDPSASPTTSPSPSSATPAPSTCASP